MTAARVPYPRPEQEIPRMASLTVQDVSQVEQLFDAVSDLPQAQQLALATQIVGRITDASCSFAVIRIGTIAQQVSGELMKANFERECG